MNELTTSAPFAGRAGPNDSIPVLTEVIELADGPFGATLEPATPEAASEAFRAAEAEAVGWSAVAPEPMSPVSAVDTTTATPTDTPVAPTDATPATAPTVAPTADALAAQVLARFRAEWQPVLRSEAEAALQQRLAPLAALLASDIAQSLESRLAVWLEATLADIAGDTRRR